jgi:hypothetical protein
MDGKGIPITEVDARIAQLQHALNSRIVVEQAKGVLAERYSLRPEEAYELIRLAARSNGIKVHALSHSVVSQRRETPAVILNLFALLPRNTSAPGRAVENVFHEVNEALLKLNGSDFVCECSQVTCSERIGVPTETMRRLHDERDLYVILPAHINADLEELVESQHDFAVVRKPGA